MHLVNPGDIGARTIDERSLSDVDLHTRRFAVHRISLNAHARDLHVVSAQPVTAIEPVTPDVPSVGVSKAPKGAARRAALGHTEPNGNRGKRACPAVQADRDGAR